MNRSIAGFRACLAGISSATEGVYGFLTSRETETLAALAAFAPQGGQILEIGSLRGKSAIVLALASRLAGERPMVAAVDPLPDVPPCAAGADGKPSAEAMLRANLAKAGVADQVTIYKMLSDELATSWQAPLRMLWIDGSHKYPAVKQDFAAFSKHLIDGGVLAMHDVLHPRCDGPLRVFADEVLENDCYWPAGVSGTIGWARYHARGDISPSARQRKRRLAKRLRSLLPLQQQDQQLAGLARWVYRWRRLRVPHRGFDLSLWSQSGANPQAA